MLNNLPMKTSGDLLLIYNPTNKELLKMNQEKKEHSTDNKPHVKDLDTKKDVKGGGGQKQQSGGTGGHVDIQPLPPTGSGT